MKQYLTPHDIANTVRMMRPQYTGSVVIVEGDSDARVYGRFIDDIRCRIVPAHGKSNVLIAMGLLDRNRTRGILAIIDCDFSHLDGIEESSANIMTTDTHDLETMIIKSKALDIVMAEFGSKSRARRVGASIRDMLLEATVPIGYLRWVSSKNQENLGVSFRDIPYPKVIKTDEMSMEANIDAIITEAKARSQHVPFDDGELKAKVTSLLESQPHDPWHVCRGHDMIHILAIGFNEVFGNRQAKRATYEQIDKIMRIAYDITEFAKSNLCSLLREWETSHPGYHIFPDD